ncbi:MAG TPA: HTH domain-containing protein [Woeseiaceae bacterium]
MPDMYGMRRKQLMRHLLRHKQGASIDELARALGVTRTAVRQHLAALARDALVAPGAERPTGGRPERLFVLTQEGREAFPRHYSWFARLLVDAIAKEHGASGLRVRLGRIAAGVVAELRGTPPPNETQRQKVESASCLLDDLGYDARTGDEIDGAPTIEADNCVFHELAMKNSEICQFDLSLLSGLTGSRVDLTECMARGGHVCRFRFTPRQGPVT